MFPSNVMVGLGVLKKLYYTVEHWALYINVERNKKFIYNLLRPYRCCHINKGWFNNYVMQWWHPLVWEKIMVGLCLCWDRGGWWGKRLCIMVFWTMLLRMPLQPRGNIPIAANITFLEDSLGHYNKTSNISISRFLIKVCLD